jgi:alkane 1-monooxygenase
MTSFRFIAAFATPATLLVALLAVTQGWPGFWFFGFLPVWYLFIITPLMDEALHALAGPDVVNEPDDRRASLWRDPRFDVWLWLWVPAQLGLQAWALVEATARFDSDRVAFWALTLGAGYIGGVGINTAHELMHRKGKPERALSELLLTSVSFAHFSIEHVLGHHKNVATPHDPASARLGEPAWKFIPRSMVGTVRSAWRLERERTQRLSIPWTSLENRRLRYPLVLAALYAAIVVGFGLPGLLFMAVQSVFAIALLEIINYIEHYGLYRDEVSPGRYVRVEPEHSWNSSHRLTSLYLFHLTRHADHHAMASRPYFALRHLTDGPQHPYGYATMMVFACAPPLWRRVMDQRVLDWRAQMNARRQAAHTSATERARGSVVLGAGVAGEQGGVAAWALQALFGFNGDVLQDSRPALRGAVPADVELHQALLHFGQATAVAEGLHAGHAAHEVLGRQRREQHTGGAGPGVGVVAALHGAGAGVVDGVDEAANRMRHRDGAVALGDELHQAAGLKA